MFTKNSLSDAEMYDKHRFIGGYFGDINSIDIVFTMSDNNLYIDVIMLI